MSYLLIEVFYIGMPVVLTDGLTYGHVITKICRMVRLLNFLVHGAPLRALCARGAPLIRICSKPFLFYILSTPYLSFSVIIRPFLSLRYTRPLVTT